MSMVPTALELKMGHRWGMGSSLFLIGAHFETNFVNVIKMGQPRALLLLFMVFSNKQYHYYNNVKNVMSIQYTVPWFEPTISWTWVVSHNLLLVCCMLNVTCKYFNNFVISIQLFLPFSARPNISKMTKNPSLSVFTRMHFLFDLWLRGKTKYASANCQWNVST